jgi:peptidoglycan/xylan/chitin deacetylase (PgdA/CDA1 family)
MSTFRRALSYLGWNLPGREQLASTAPVVIVYHGVPRENDRMIGRDLESHVIFLRRHFQLISWRQLEDRRLRHERIQVLLTFDDGLRNNAEVVAPILRRHRVPAIFFVCSRHTRPGQYLWFSYLRMLERHFPWSGFNFRGEYMDMNPAQREKTIRRLREVLLAMTPHPFAMYEAIENELPLLEEITTEAERHEHCAGMTEDQIAELASDSLFSIGAHTIDHPFPTKCASGEAERQIRLNKEWIERITGRTCDTLAYPIADYDEGVLQVCHDLGFRQAFSVERKIQGPPELQIPRVGIYFPSLAELGLKIRWATLLNSLQRQRLMLR